MNASIKTFVRPPKSLLHPVGKAIADFAMIREGDRVMVGVSGGKDSLSLLHILHDLQRRAPIRFELAALTVDPQVDGFKPETLKPYMAELGVAYYFVSQPIMAQAKQNMDGDSFCAYCSRMKRGIMYSTLRQQGYNVLALGQHLDDLAESFLLSAFHGGQLRTMKACYDNDAGDVRVIRPLAYARERQTAAFAEQSILPVIPDSCPACFEMPTQRQHMKELLASEEVANPGLFNSLLTALRPMMHGEFYAREAVPKPAPQQPSSRAQEA